MRRFDQVLITKREFDNVIVWNEYIMASKATKLKKLKPNEKNIRNRPPEKEEKTEEEKKASA